MCAPEMGPSMVIRTNSIAPVASVLPRSAIASFPRDRFSAMMPEPITQANRKKEPKASAPRRLANANCSGNGHIRVPDHADLLQPRLQAQPVETLERQVHKNPDAIEQHAIGVEEGRMLDCAAAFYGSRIRNPPMRRHRLPGPDGAHFIA